MAKARILRKIWDNRYFKNILDVILVFSLPLILFLSLRLALGVEHPLLVVSSGSMMPTLNIGDLLVVQGISPTQINIGDIVVFRNPRKPADPPIVHRVVDIKVDDQGNYMIATLGDATSGSFDQFSPWNASLYLIGKVIMKVPYIGHLYLFLYGAGNGVSKILFILITIIVILLILTLFTGEEDERKSTSEARNRRKRHVYLAYIVAVNALIVGMIFFSLWAYVEIWQPGAVPPQQVKILGMYEELKLNAAKYGDKNVFLEMGFMTYRINCRLNNNIRLGAASFSWSQLLFLFLMVFNVNEVVLPILKKRIALKFRES